MDKQDFELELIRVLGLPKRTTRATLTVGLDIQPAVECEYYPADSHEIKTMRGVIVDWVREPEPVAIDWLARVDEMAEDAHIEIRRMTEKAIIWVNVKCAVAEIALPFDRLARVGSSLRDVSENFEKFAKLWPIGERDPVMMGYK